jgi:hypothetical protein
MSVPTRQPLSGASVSVTSDPSSVLNTSGRPWSRREATPDLTTADCSADPSCRRVS